MVIKNESQGINEGIEFLEKAKAKRDAQSDELRRAIKTGEVIRTPELRNSIDDVRSMLLSAVISYSPQPSNEVGKPISPSATPTLRSNAIDKKEGFTPE
jgi:hypothetical protein